MSLKDEMRSRSPLRRGVVVAQDLTLARVRVQFGDMDQVTSYWLDVPRRRAHLDQDAELPDVGDMVACVMDDGEDSGVVIGAVANQQDPPPAGLTKDWTYRRWNDGTVVKYDRAAHAFSIALGAPATLEITQPSGSSVLVDASGNLKFTAPSGQEISFNGDSDALALVSKLVAAFNAHTHGGVQTGTGATATPSTPWIAATIESGVLKAGQ